MSAISLIQIHDPPAREPAGVPWQERLERLKSWIGAYRRVVVAYSGGVDSSVVLRVACEVLGKGAIGAIGRSDSYPERELKLAIAQAASFGAQVEEVTTGELSDPDFRSNPTDRCYHCKRELYRELSEMRSRLGAEAILDGTIADDIGDWRPGRQAAHEMQVKSPLAELGFAKADVRAVAAHYGLASQDKPASPCLASRIPYGSEITREKLTMVEQAEGLLRSLGFTDLRVRHHDQIARLELPLSEMARMLEPGVREAVTAGLKALGFVFVTLDLEGFRSGSLNTAAGIWAASAPSATTSADQVMES